MLKLQLQISTFQRTVPIGNEIGTEDDKEKTNIGIVTLSSSALDQVVPFFQTELNEKKKTRGR